MLGLNNLKRSWNIGFSKKAVFFSLCIINFSAFSQALPFSTTNKSIAALSQGLAFEAANKTITSLGAQGDIYYFRIQEPLEAQCAYSIIYIPADKKTLYVQVLSAKMTGKKLSRLSYTLTNGPNSECHAYIVEIE